MPKKRVWVVGKKVINTPPTPLFFFYLFRCPLQSERQKLRCTFLPSSNAWMTTKARRAFVVMQYRFHYDADIWHLLNSLEYDDDDVPSSPFFCFFFSIARFFSLFCTSLSVYNYFEIVFHIFSKTCFVGWNILIIFIKSWHTFLGIPN